MSGWKSRTVSSVCAIEESFELIAIDHVAVVTNEYSKRHFDVDIVLTLRSLSPTVVNKRIHPMIALHDPVHRHRVVPTSGPSVYFYITVTFFLTMCSFSMC